MNTLPLGITVAAFMAEQRVGALRAGPRAELIGGRVVLAERPGAAHSAAVLALEDRLRALSLGREGVVIARAPALRLGPTDLLRPDLALLVDAELVPAASDRTWSGRERHGSQNDRSVAPGLGGSHDPAAALLVVEVSRGRVSLEQRLPLFAAAGVRELWLIDLQQGWTEALRSPWRGVYRSRTLWYPGERVPVVALAGVMVEALAPP